MPAHGGPAVFTVLFVCTGNICRSPLAENLLREQLKKLAIPVSVHSAGTRAVIGHGMTPEAIAVSRRFGVSDDLHVARQLTHELVASADLVLTATREQRSAAVSLHPRASRNTYTVTQFARLLSALALDDRPINRPEGEAGNATATLLRGLIAEVAASRGFSPPLEDPAEDDIEDPYKKSVSVYERVGAQINSAVAVLAHTFAWATTKA